MQGLKIKKLVICLAATLPIIANAYEPSVTALGMGGIYTSGWAEGLMPLYMNSQHMIYSDLQFEGNSTNAGSLSVGSGYRQQIHSQDIVGAYLFYDRERSASEHYYNVISPGVEYLTPSWQYRFNYYAPFGTKSYLISQGLAEEFGNYQYESFSGNSKTDSMQYNYESLSYGADFTVGYRFQADKRWQVNVSPYVFNQTDDNALMGANAQLNFYTNDHTTIFLGDGYDNVNHNRVFIGISLTFGGHNNDDSVDNLMQSSVYRNLDVNTTSNGLPINDYSEFSAPQQQPGFYSFVDDSVTDSANLGTIESPYSSIDQISGAPADAHILVASTGINYSSDSLTLTGTQTIGGYTDGYKVLATGSDRPIIQSDEGVVLEGDNTITSLQVLSNGSPTAAGITINGNGTLNNVNVGSEETETSFQTGVQLTSGASGIINDSTITAYEPSDGVDNVIGVNSDNATLEINDSTINAINDISSSARLNYGINLFGGTLTLDNVNVNCESDLGNSHAVFVNETGDITVTNSTLMASSLNGNASGFYIFSEAGDITISDSTINATSDVNGGHAYGVYSSGNNGNLVVTGSQINVAADATAIGVDVVSGTGSATITDNTITVTATTASGISGSSTHTGNTYDINGTISSD